MLKHEIQRVARAFINFSDEGVQRRRLALAAARAKINHEGAFLISSVAECVPISEESGMKTFVIATLLGLFLSPPALASQTDCAQQMRSNSSKAASGYVYVNRLDAPGNTHASATTSAAQRLSNQL